MRLFRLLEFGATPARGKYDTSLFDQAVVVGPSGRLVSNYLLCLPMGVLHVISCHVGWVASLHRGIHDDVQSHERVCGGMRTQLNFFNI